MEMRCQWPAGLPRVLQFELAWRHCNSLIQLLRLCTAFRELGVLCAALFDADSLVLCAFGVWPDWR